MARQAGARVIGLRQGFQWLMQGEIDHVLELRAVDVARIHEQGGSVLQTSRANPTKKPEDLQRVVRALGELGIDRLISIGGDDTCHSARCLGEAAGERLRVVHVPKTIDNDLPLPEGIPTFGYETARENAGRILTALLEDARTTARWYVVVLMGRNAGHLAQGAAKSAGATVTLVAEEFDDGAIRLDDVARIIEGTIVKRTALGEPHGVIVLAEGIGDRLDPADLADLPNVPLDEHGHVRLAELPLGKLVRDRVQAGLAEVGIKTTMVAKDVGYELRCAPPNAFDQEYTRDLGAGAVRTLLAGGANVMITRQNQEICTIPFDQILDPQTGRTRIRLLDVSSAAYHTARALQVRLEADDLTDAELTARITAVTRLDGAAIRSRYAGPS
jgi:6-phosphofructokinase 1